MRLGTRSDNVDRQSALARGIFREHLVSRRRYHVSWIALPLINPEQVLARDSFYTAAPWSAGDGGGPDWAAEKSTAQRLGEGRRLCTDVASEDDPQYAPRRRGSTASAVDIADALSQLVEVGGSDLCLKVGNSPLIRIDGKLGWLNPDAAELRPEDTMEMLHAVLTDARVKEFESLREIDFAYSVPRLARFRVNAYTQRGSVSMVFRVVPQTIRSLAISAFRMWSASSPRRSAG